MNTKLTVNGQVHELEIEPHETLSQVLRNKLGLHGVRVSCTEGECGSCTVLLDGEPVTSCLMLALQAEGKEITTIEGLGTEENLHPIQEAFIEEQGYQCGFCTPGIILSTKAFLKKNPNPSVSEVASALSGNICRCGAYVHIARSVLNAAKKMEGKKSSKS
jgi:aerobic-type carbon monoxide dehydrogenase small subunit (CoxS/CutS family)